MTVRARLRRGVTLVETMIASTILAILVIALFEGVAFSARIAQENAEFLAADAYAFDLAWKRFHENYAELKNLRAQLNGAALVETVSSNAVPLIWRRGAEARSSTRVAWARDRNGKEDQSGLVITVDVEWGPANRRRTLAPDHVARVLRSGTGGDE